jgi:3-hydroxybutyryl-CoA dehydrogenase
MKVTDYWAEVLQDPQMKKNADFICKYVEEGKLGAKNGRGFYEYPNPAFVKPGFIDKK